MAAYGRVYDSRQLQADCQEPGSAPEPYAWQSSMGYLYLFISYSQFSQSSVGVLLQGNYILHCKERSEFHNKSGKARN